MSDYQNRIDAIRTREEAATKGPWNFYDGDTYANVAADLKMTGPGSYQCRQQIARLEDEDVYDDQQQQEWDEDQAAEQMTANAAFIAHARQDVPFLLDRIAELEDTLKQICRLHTDSPMGPCPVCIDADAQAAGGDGLLPYPCPTARLAGAQDCDPPSFRDGRHG